jgi:hypothetical protein
MSRAAIQPSTPISGRRGSYDYEYSLDVLSSGSEATEPTVFLTAARRRRRPRVPSTSSTATNTGVSSDPADEIEDQGGTVLSRYAISGLGDMAARLVADQKLSWGSTKAVFCHNNHHHGNRNTGMSVNGGGLWGIPGLLLALHKAGAPEVAFVTGHKEDASRVEAMVELLEVHRSHPRVSISSVPLTKKEPVASWWKMYHDDYLLVHATCHEKLEQLIYLFTCLQHDIPNYTIAVLTSHQAFCVFLELWSELANRVVLETPQEGPQPLSVRAIFTIDSTQLDSPLISEAESIFPDTPVLQCRSTWRDDGILLRAQHLTDTWHRLLPEHIIHRSECSSADSCGEKTARGSQGVAHMQLLSLSSCSTVRFIKPLQVVDRKIAIRQRIRQSNPSVEDVKHLRDFLQPQPSSSNFCSHAHDKAAQPDENEIVLDDSDEENQEDPSEAPSEKEGDENVIALDSEETSSASLSNMDPKDSSVINAQNTYPKNALPSHCKRPHLLVLGTGCASPSPVRGSSGYGLLFPQQVQTMPSKEALLLTAVIECGKEL